MFARMRRPAIPGRLTTGHMPAPVGGMTTLGAGSAMPANKCVQSFNLNGGEYGLRARLGWREWVTNLTGTSDDLVRSILPFGGPASDGSDNKLFATTSSGIWDVSASTTSPSLVLAFSVDSGNAGYGVAHAMQTSAGHFLIYCDEENGLHVYTRTTDTWAAVSMGGGGTQISGVDPSTFVHVTSWKQRLVFVERDTERLWYMTAGSLYGAASAFPVGARFRAGGSAVGVWNWSIDAGEGLDDMLVIISQAGDVVMYKGTDPSSANTISIQGVWYMGDAPAGRQIATSYGGDLLLMSRSGIVPLSKLIAGNEDKGQYTTADVANLFNQLMLTRATVRGWSMRIHPEENALVVTVPETEGTATNQLVMSLTTRGWGKYRDLPIYSSEAYGGKLYFGTIDGRICINDGYVDGVTLADPDVYSSIDWALLTSFQNLGNASMKQVQIIRPVMLTSTTNPAIAVEARYDFNFAELATVPPAAASGDAWDSAVWDTALWGGEYNAMNESRGATGIGVHVALAARGSATTRTIIVGFDVGYETGGLL